MFRTNGLKYYIHHLASHTMKRNRPIVSDHTNMYDVRMAFLQNTRNVGRGVKLYSLTRSKSLQHTEH